MQKIGMLTLACVALAAPGRAGDIYRWTDGAGKVHYSNMAADGDDARAVEPGSAPSDAAASATADEADAREGAAPAGEVESYSASASLRRNALERELRATERRLRDLDGRLATLARARGQHAQGSAATGGVGTAALDFRSEEEKALATEREQLAQHEADVRSDAARLRDEVTARLGGTPTWWIDPH
jgi:uncharacterized protein DUF4124